MKNIYLISLYKIINIDDYLIIEFTKYAFYIFLINMRKTLKKYSIY